MIIVNAKIEATADTIDAMKAAIEVMETASQQEPGCDDYCFSVELNNPNVMRITEKWQSMDDLVKHFSLPHMAEFQAAMAAHPPKSVTANFFEATEIDMPTPG